MTTGARRWKGAGDDQKRAKRELILEAATIELNRLGFAGASMSRIARHIGLSTSAPYYYFESKEEILYQCFARSNRLIQLRIDQAEKLDENGHDKVVTFFLSLFELLTEVALPDIQLIGALSHDRAREIERTGYGQMDRIGTFLAEGIRDGSVRAGNPIKMARFLFGGTYWIFYEVLANRETLDDTRDTLLEMVHNAIE